MRWCNMCIVVCKGGSMISVIAVKNMSQPEIRRELRLFERKEARFIHITRHAAPPDSPPSPPSPSNQSIHVRILSLFARTSRTCTYL